MNFTTGVFLDCGDEQITADLLSEQYNIQVTAADVRSIRIEAATAAARLEAPAERKRWTFRYRRLTLNALIREYMFITNVPNFMEAKIDLADEAFWLAQKCDRPRLCIALNDALGRNNLAIELLDELLSFRETLLRIKSMVAAAPQGSSSPLFLFELAEKTDAFAKEARGDLPKSAQYVCDLLTLKQGSISPSDARFLCEYHQGGDQPDLTDENGLLQFFDEPSISAERSALETATRGNLLNLSPDELQLIYNALRTKPLLETAQLQALQKAVQRKLDRGDADDVIKSLHTLLEGQIMVSNVENLYTRPERFKMGLRGLAADEIARHLLEANRLTSREEIRALFRKIGSDEARAAMAAELLTRYMSKRFG